jgi:hypothetical protein
VSEFEGERFSGVLHEAQKDTQVMGFWEPDGMDRKQRFQEFLGSKRDYGYSNKWVAGLNARASGWGEHPIAQGAFSGLNVWVMKNRQPISNGERRIKL